MAFIRKRQYISKRKGERFSYQLIETYREGGRVKQRVLLNLGRDATIEAARQSAQESLEYWSSPQARSGGLSQDPDFHAWCRRHAEWRVAGEKAYLEKLESVVSRLAQLRLSESVVSEPAKFTTL